MSRSADYTIKGFLYQFNKSLIEILSSASDDVVTLEGIVEDIEVHTANGATATQCKYHEAAESFAPSSIYKPVLQMMEHYQTNPRTRVRYVLFCHYPGMQDAPGRTDLKTYLQGALESKNAELKRLTETLRGKVNIEGFLSKFSMQVGPTLDQLAEHACTALETNGFPRGEIETLAYPNAIHIIAMASSKHSLSDRTIKKREFIERLTTIRKTAISRWTMALATRKKILEAKRRQLKTHLNINTRVRCFVVDLDRLENQSEGFVLFVKDYLDKYHCKLVHTCTPIFCLRATKESFSNVRVRLSQKGIIAADGFVADHFDKSLLFREPICVKRNGEIRRDFFMRILRWEDHATLLNEQKLDDLFILAEEDFGLARPLDVEVELLSTTSLKELKYIMGVSDVYE